MLRNPLRGEIALCIGNNDFLQVQLSEAEFNDKATALGSDTAPLKRGCNPVGQFCSVDAPASMSVANINKGDETGWFFVLYSHPVKGLASGLTL